MSSWTPGADVLATDWFRRVRESQRVHYECGGYFSRRHLWLGIPAVVLAAVVGTSVFASLQDGSDLTTRLMVGGLSIVAAILTSLQTFLGLAERAEKHRVAGSGYGALRRRLEHLKTFPPADSAALQSELAKVKGEMDRLARTSPEVPTLIKHRVDKELKKRGHNRIFVLPPANE